MEWIFEHPASTAFLVVGVGTLVTLMTIILRSEANATREANSTSGHQNAIRENLHGNLPEVPSEPLQKPSRMQGRPTVSRPDVPNGGQTVTIPNGSTEDRGANSSGSHTISAANDSGRSLLDAEKDVLEQLPKLEPKIEKFIWKVPPIDSDCLSSEHYPIVRFPETGTPLLRPIKKTRQGNKGHLEEKFMLQLQEFLAPQPKKISVSTQHSLQKPGGFFEPDFVLVASDRGNRILLDVEIDEPYAGGGTTVTHCMGKDDIRNEYFLKSGWIVIRFAEVQVVRQPELCCEFILSVIQQVTDNRSICGNVNLKSLIVIPRWDSVQAEAWQREKYREQYLKISAFGSGSQKPSKDVNELEDGELAETAGLRTIYNVPLPPIKAQKTASEAVSKPETKASGKFLSFRFIPLDTKAVDFKGTSYLKFKLADRYHNCSFVLIQRTDMFKRMSEFQTVEYSNYPISYKGSSFDLEAADEDTILFKILSD